MAAVDLHGLIGAAYERVSKDATGVGRSVKRQYRYNEEVATREGIILKRHYEDNDKSASGFSAVVRKDYQVLIAHLEDGKYQVLVVWEPSRLTREGGEWSALIDICKRKGVLICANGNVYDPSDDEDLFTLQLFFILAERETNKLRKRVMAGLANNHRNGVPHGRCPLGYVRRYNEHTRNLEGQDVDPVGAAVVTQIFTKFNAGNSAMKICKDLQAQGVPTPLGKNPWWATETVKAILRNPAYIGKLVVKGEIYGNGMWDPIITEEVFYATQAILASRKALDVKPRPGGARHLTTGASRCGKCGGVIAWRKKLGRSVGAIYRCGYRGCVSINADSFDGYVVGAVTNYLSLPEIYGQYAVPADDARVINARAELELAQRDRRNLEANVKAGKVKAVYASAEDAAIQQRVDDAHAVIDAITLPAILRPVIGPEAARKFAGLTDAQRRQVVEMCVQLTIEAAATRSAYITFQPERVTCKWLLGEPNVA